MKTETTKTTSTTLDALASALIARANCEQSDNSDWFARWDTYVTELMDAAPSGSGFDAGTDISQTKCSATLLTLTTGFHHMNDAGCYDGWTEHVVRVRPSFIGRYDITVSGRNRNDIKDYIADVFSAWLDSQAPRPSWQRNDGSLAA